jgi:TnpA family transposase
VSYGEILLQQIRDTVENDIMGWNIQRQQIDNMMHVCILASLTEQAAAVIYLKINKYKASNGEDLGLLLLKLVISELTLETNQL